MCLATINSKEEIDEFKKTIPPEGITVYKVVNVYKEKYYPLFLYTSIPFRSGLNKANTTQKIRTDRWLKYDNYIYQAYDNYIYQAGFHFFTNKEDAERYNKWHGLHYKVIKCKIKKSWITSVGMNKIGEEIEEYGQTVVTNKAIFPKHNVFLKIMSILLKMKNYVFKNKK